MSANHVEFRPAFRDMRDGSLVEVRLVKADAAWKTNDPDDIVELVRDGQVLWRGRRGHARAALGGTVVS